VFVALLGIGAGIALAFNGPFRPGDAFFSFQHFSEQSGIVFSGNATGRAQYVISIAERRAVDLSSLGGTRHEQLALGFLDKALDQALRALVAVPESDQAAMQTEMLLLIEHAQAALKSLTILPVINPNTLTAFQAKLSTLRALTENPALAQASVGVQQGNAPLPQAEPQGQSGQSTGLLDPEAVDFPPGSAGAQHDFFPLIGAHANLDCQACHSSGQYTGTPNTCESCHLSVRPADHFSGNCATCHTPSTWQDIIFDHSAAGATDCVSCHSKNKPANHFAGQCSSCHSTNAWKPANFNHQAAGATDCVSCHSKNEPANHFAGQCSACHSTNAWKPANFNHQAAGATDCASCHTKDKPANHFDGQCSACHSTNAWKPAHFDHQNAGGDCAACHLNDRPANHFQGQCSQCHNTSNWGDASFNHNFPINHKGADGVCAKCHPSGTSSWTCYTCHKQGETEKHHEEKGILNIASRCVACHPNGKKED
jgi:hypothetical protein